MVLNFMPVIQNKCKALNFVVLIFKNCKIFAPCVNFPLDDLFRMHYLVRLLIADPGTAEVIIEVHLPDGRSIIVRVSESDDVRQIKSKIEAVEPCYPPHQRLVQPGCLDNLMDDSPLIPLLRNRGFNLVLRGNNKK